jgi:hypothetical protein
LIDTMLTKRIVAQILALVVLTLLVGATLAQTEPEVRVSAEVDRDTITVGDHIVYTVRAEHRKDLVVDFPQLGSAWGDFEVLSQRPLRPAAGEQGQVITGKEYVVTTFTTGEHTTPRLQVSYLNPDGDPQDVETEPIRITVTSILAATESVTNTIDIRDLKPQAELPRDWSWLLWAGLAYLALMLALLTVLWFVIRRKKGAAAIPTPVAELRPPEEIAYEELERIAGRKLVEQGRFKEHYTLIADCLRRYAEGIYGIPAMDRTTEEFKTALRQSRVDGRQARMFNDWLAECDLVKFAKHVPPVEDAQQTVTRARHIVDVTKPERVIAGEGEKGGS